MNPTALLQTISRLLTLRSSPAMIPASYTLLVAAAAAYLLLGGWLYATLGQASSRVFIDLLVMAALLFALLRWREHDDRLLQTLTAYLVCSSVLTALAAPALISGVEAGEKLSVNASYFIVAVMLWDLLVSAHILRCAMSIPMLGAIALSFALMVVSVSVGDFVSSWGAGENNAASDQLGFHSQYIDPKVVVSGVVVSGEILMPEGGNS